MADKSRTIPNDSSYSLPTFSIFVDGKEIDASYQILTLEVNKAAN